MFSEAWHYLKTRFLAALAVLFVGYPVIQLLAGFGLLPSWLALVLSYGLLALVVVILVPALSRRIGFDDRVRGLSKDERADLSKEELRAASLLQNPRRWAEPASVSHTVQKLRTVTDRDGRSHERMVPHVLYPRRVGSVMTPQGVAVEFETVRGGPIPGQWDAARIGAAVGFKVAVIELAPSRVQVVAVTRDPLAAPAPTVPGPASTAPSPADFSDWADVEDEDR